MALKTGRLGFIGIAIESTPGTPVAPSQAIPFTANTIMGKHTPIDNIAGYGSRAQNRNSTIGKRWGEGDITVNADSLNIGYFLKLAAGNEIVNTIQAGVYDHLFFTTYSGNLPLTATLTNYQGVDTQQYASMAIDKLDFEVKDSLMTAKAAFKGYFPTSGTFANTTVSGTLFDFVNYSVQFGNNLLTTANASQTPITDFSCSIENNLETIFESGNSITTRVFWKQLKISGSWTMFFETTTQRDNYYNLNKQSMILTASGMALPGSNYERMVIRLARLEWSDQEITTGLEDFFAVKTSFVAEFDDSQGLQYDMTLRNYRSSVYT